MKTRKYFFAGGIIIFLLLSGIYLSILLFVGGNTVLDNKVPSDAILVLGAKSYKNGDYNPCLVSRVIQAVDLYQEKFAPKIIVSGGNDLEDGVNEAETMKKIATSLGVPPEDILLEPASTSTYENFVFSKEVLKSVNLNSIIIVTEPFHAARAGLVAEKLGFKFSISPASKSSCWLKWQYLSPGLLREPFAIMAYKAQNKL